MNILFRVDGSQKIGNGHFMRCLALSEYLKKVGHNTYFVSRKGSFPGVLKHGAYDKVAFIVDALERDQPIEEPWPEVSQKKDAEATLHAFAGEPIDWVVVDHYGLNSIWERSVGKVGLPLFVVDDLNRDHHCDFLVDMTLGKDKTTYSHLRTRTKIFAGGGTAILGPKLLRARPEAFESRHQRLQEPRRVLVNMGSGAGPLKVEAVVDALLENRKTAGLNVFAVVGQGAFNRVLKKYQSFKNVEVCAFTDNMVGEILRADIGVGAAGVASYERAFLGLPSIILQTAENQSANVAGFIENDLGPVIPQEKMKDLEQHLPMALECLMNPQNRRRYRDRCFSSISPFGLFRSLEEAFDLPLFRFEPVSHKQQEDFPWLSDDSSFRDFFRRVPQGSPAQVFVSTVHDIVLGFFYWDWQVKAVCSQFIVPCFSNMGLEEMGPLALARQLSRGEP